MIVPKKYLKSFEISWESGFIYRLNFIMWRVRMVVQNLTVYFLWLAVLSKQDTAFSYTKPELLTYVIGTSLVVSIVFSSRSVDAQGEISSGDLNNYLVKPINYFTYWFSRDVADKLLNIIFSIVELTLIYLLLKPPLLIAQSANIILSLVATFIAMIMYYYFSFIISLTTFWWPEGNGWPQRFFIYVLLRFFSGGLFPLDILPTPLYNIIKYLPTAHFLNTPLQIYLDRFSTPQAFQSILVMIIWIFILKFIAQKLFQRGLKIYGAYGR